MKVVVQPMVVGGELVLFVCVVVGLYAVSIMGTNSCRLLPRPRGFAPSRLGFRIGGMRLSAPILRRR